jgi:hypothetical protein
MEDLLGNKASDIARAKSGNAFADFVQVYTQNHGTGFASRAWHFGDC